MPDATLLRTSLVGDELCRYIHPHRYRLPISDLTSYRGRRAGWKVIEKEKVRNHPILPLVTHYRSETQKFTSRPRVLVDIKATAQPSVNKSTNKCKIAVWNARSLKSKTTEISDLILSDNLDIFTITETWLTGNDNDNRTIADLTNTLADHRIVHVPRNRRGGGVCIILRKGFNVVNHSTTSYSSFEFLDLLVTSGSNKLRLLTVYRPPPSNKNKLTTTMFLDEFSSLLESLALSPGYLLITGDFNFHVDAENRDALLFLEMLECFGLTHHVREPTHNRGHILDLVITRSSNVLIYNINVSFDLPSDHATLTFRLEFPRPKASRALVKSRKIRNIDMNAFRLDISKSTLIANPSSNLTELTNQYNCTLTGLLDKHAPVRTRYITLRPHAPWYINDTLQPAKQERRRRERKWRKSGLEIDLQLYKDQCRHYHRLLEELKTTYHKDKIKNCDQRELFQEVDKMFNVNKCSLLPSSESILADLFADYFAGKTQALRDNLTDKFHTSLNSEVVKPDCSLTTFEALSSDQVKNIVMKSNSKSCSLDPIPTGLLKDNLTHLIIPITQIINYSLSSATVPPCFKRARVIPLIKKLDLDPDVLSNYRPISNLPFLSKVLERVVLAQLQKYLNNNKLYAKMQSAYRPHHSTETALLKVQNDILRALDQGQEAVLVLLDFSSAFDTIDHKILLSRLEQCFGITDKAIHWFLSYLQGRTQSVSVNGIESPPQSLVYGVPQGSVLGPVLFTLYITPLEDIISRHGINCMMYADDSQLFLSMKAPEKSTTQHKFQDCIAEIKTWTIENKLCLNDSKTEVVHFYSKFTNPSPMPGIDTGCRVVSPVTEARDLGVLLDKHLSMKSHITKICKSSSFGIRKISKIRKFLDKDSAERLVHAFVTSHLDSCNSLLYGLPAFEIKKLQHIQNIAARVVTKTKQSDHITPILKKLHWLPVQSRIKFKILLLTFKALHDLAPGYIKDLLVPYNTHRALRSSNKNLLHVPKSKTCTYGERAFCAIAPALWNNLPDELRLENNLCIFKSELKTFLFKEYY